MNICNIINFKKNKIIDLAAVINLIIRKLRYIINCFY